MVREAVGGDSIVSDHELKKLLQETIMSECSDIMQRYNYRLVKISAGINPHSDCYTFAVGISPHPNDPSKTLCIHQEVPRSIIFDYPMKYHRYSSNMTATQALASSEGLRRTFYYFAKNIRKEIENRTKDMPIMTNLPHFPLHTVNEIRAAQGQGLAYIGQWQTAVVPNQIGDDMWNKVMNVDMQQVTSFTDPKPKKKSKFSYIDSLINDSKQRLCGGYAQPAFAFKHF